MAQQDDIKKELEGLAPKLASLKRSKADAGIPEGYFEQLEGEISEKVFPSVEKVNQGRVVKLWTYTSIAVAACIALFFLTRQPAQIIEYPSIDPLSDAEEFMMETFETEDLEMFYSASLEDTTTNIDAESILIEENHLEELLNI